MDPYLHKLKSYHFEISTDIDDIRDIRFHKFQFSLIFNFEQAKSKFKYIVKSKFTIFFVLEGSLTLAMGKCLWFSVKIKVCQSSLSSACICVTIFYTYCGSGLLAQGWERCSAAPKPRALAHKMSIFPNKKLMTVMKFSRINLLNRFVFLV